jgi:hypothetical protein
VPLPGAFEPIDETLIVCPESDARVAIRGAAIEVDRLADRKDGLELWRRSMSATFPLCQRDVRDVLRQYPLVPPVLYRPEYTAFDFVTEVAACTNHLRVLGLRRIHRGVSIDDCLLERDTFSLAGTTLQSVAVSGVDPQSIRRLITRLGLDRLENVNSVSLVKRVLDLRPDGRIPSVMGDFSHAR